jgi:thiamine-phosphate pyrophosphorylase
LPSCLLVTDEQRGNPLTAVRHLPSGAAILVRHYHAPDREEIIRTLSWAARPRGVRVLIGVTGPKDLALATRVEADGLHLPEGVLRSGILSPLYVWRSAGQGRLLTAAAHSLTALRRVEDRGLDAAILSPVFPTQSHPGAAVLGPLRVRAWVRSVTIPVLVLGGLSVRTVRSLTGAGVWGGAAISGLTPNQTSAMKLP